MRADLVVETAERLGLIGQSYGVGDLEAEQVLVLDRAVEAFDHAVGLWRVVAGPDVGDLGPARDEMQEVGALVGRTVVGHDRERSDLASGRVDAVFQKRMAHQSLGLLDRGLDGGDCITSAGRARDGRRQSKLGRVVDDRAYAPSPALARLDLGEVGLPDSVASSRSGHEQRPPCGRESASLGLITPRQEQITPGERTQDRAAAHVDAIGAQHGPALAMTPC